VTAEEHAALVEVFDGRRPWRADRIDALVTFGRALVQAARLEAGAPRCNVGDALTSLGLALPVEEDRRWAFDPGVDSEVLGKLGFRQASEGIARARQHSREGWWAHARRNRAFILRMADSLPRRRLAVVLGAGQAFDLPLVELAGAFERLILVDIDGEALETTAASALKDRDLLGTVERKVMDLTGAGGTWVRRLDAIFEEAGEADEALAAVTDLCRSYKLPGGVVLAPGEARADLLVSSCVLSQLAVAPYLYAERRWQERFGPLRGPTQRSWAVAWRDVTLRMQQDHLNGLTAAAGVAVLTSEVVNHATILDTGGTERPNGRSTLALGVTSLRERLPVFLTEEGHEAWRWHRARSRGAEGSFSDVEGVAVRDDAASDTGR
jgi:hypothetical protein